MKLCAPLQINQGDEDIVEQEKKIAQQAQLPRTKLCWLSRGINSVKNKLDKTDQMNLRVWLR